MSAAIIPLRGHDDSKSTVHVIAGADGGFEIGHESASGDSWGNFSGPYSTGQAAIAAAYALNRDQYGGDCNVFVCERARLDWTAQAARKREEF